jgi:hypothetical protein
MKKTITDALFKVRNVCVKEEFDVEKFDLISSSAVKHGEENSTRRGQQSPMSNGPSQTLFESRNKNVEIVKLGSLQGLVSFSKEVYPQIKEEDRYHSYSDANTPLCIVLKRNPARPLPCEGGLSHGKQLQALTKIKREPIGGPKSARMGPVGVPHQKRKSPMQPFAHLPLNTKGLPKPLLDGRHKRAKWRSIQERVGGICTRDYSSDNEKKRSNSPDSSSGAEVKGDVDYTIGN